MLKLLVAKRSHYHFITESVLSLYEKLKDNLDCMIWHDGFGPTRELLGLFSKYPVKRIEEEGTDIEIIHYDRLLDRFYRLRDMAKLIISRIPSVKREEKITIIKRVGKRVYKEVDALANKLENVRVVQLENMSMIDQVNCMRTTRILIAPHGAGTINQIFLPLGSLVVELFPLHSYNWEEGAIAKGVGNELRNIESEEPGDFFNGTTKEVREYILGHNWFDKPTIKKMCGPDRFLLTVARHVCDVAYSIPPEKIIALIKDRL